MLCIKLHVGGKVERSTTHTPIKLSSAERGRSERNLEEVTLVILGEEGSGCCVAR